MRTFDNTIILNSVVLQDVVSVVVVVVGDVDRDAP
jgi:hypothetical protein